MSTSAKTYGLLAEFDTAAGILNAAITVRDSGFAKWDVYTPFPIHGMDDAMGVEKSQVGWFTFAGGVCGFSLGMSMIWFMNGFNYPLVVGGKPLFNPFYAFPVSYELTILLGSFGTLFGMLLLNGLPRWHNPLLANERFRKASDDRYFICIQSADPKFAQARAALEQAGAVAVEEVEE